MSSTTRSLLPLLLLASTLAAIPVLQATSPGVRIVRAPESIVAPNGDEVVFECETSLAPDRFEWSHRRAQNISSTRPAHKLKYSKLVPGKPGSGLPLSAHNISVENAISKLRVFVRPDTLGEYRCVGWFGPLAVTSTIARLELASIALENSTDGEPKALHWRVTAGNTVLLSCGQVMSRPSPAWSFYRDGVELKPTATASNGTLVLPQVTVAQSGKYTCAATNTVSGIKIVLPRWIELQIFEQNGETIAQAPHFLAGQHVQRQIIAREGDTVLLMCPGVGTPKPVVVWSSPNVPTTVHKHTQDLAYGREISNVQAHDAGTYICYMDNGIRPTLEHFVNLTVQQPARIIQAPSANLTNEGDMLELQCVATGVPTPEIYWLLNGESGVNGSKMLPNGFLMIRNVQKHHAGYVQCFARNILGEQSAATLLQVNPKQIQSEPRHGMGSHRPMRLSHERKQTQMIPPSAPNVTRLSDESVMLRWHVPRNDGLLIQFFKVQYRMVGESNKRKNWQTTNENIYYGKPKWNSEYGKSFTASVTDLKPQRYYRFRILAVYSNNDNKESNTSPKFFLQRGNTLEPLPVPELVDIEEHSETAVVLHWRLANAADEQLISGYYAYYRPSSSAGEYYKATIEGAQTRSFQIASLETGTIYEFKLQSFSSLAASEFSALKQGRTLRPMSTTTEQTIVHALDTTTPSHNETFNVNPMLTGTIGGGALLLLVLVTACLCICRRRGARVDEVDKPGMAELREDFVPLGKTRPRHIHITLNPLAQHEEKSSPTSQDNELAYFQHQPGYESETHVFNGLARMPSSSLRRSQRTLERGGGGGGGNNSGNNNNLNQALDNGLTANADSPRMQRNNKTSPGRVMIKRTRLSSRSENLSSGSLNSVGV